MISNPLALTVSFFVIAVVYASVGHGGASGYLAVMALAGVVPAEMRPTALALNLAVSGISALRFARAGAFSLRVFLPFALASAPFAFLGGRLTLPQLAYRQIVGAALLVAASWLLRSSLGAPRDERTRPLPLRVALPLGAALGALSGITGVGGGIFLSPLLLLARWSDARVTAGVSAAFIFVNSAAGLAGQWTRGVTLSPWLLLWSASALAGGTLGATLGSRYLGSAGMRRILAAVLVVAGMKMLLAGR